MHVPKCKRLTDGLEPIVSNTMHPHTVSELVSTIDLLYQCIWYSYGALLQRSSLSRDFTVSMTKTNAYITVISIVKKYTVYMCVCCVKLQSLKASPEGQLVMQC